MNRLLGSLALCGFILSAAVHLAAVLGLNVAQRIPTVWLLHVGIFVVFVPFVFSTRRVRGGLDAFLASLPSWVMIMGVALFSYALINFALFMSRTEGGNPSIEKGRFVLLNHGRLIREITAQEYESFRTNEVRGFSGHWLLFYFLPFAYFMFTQQPNKSPQHNAGAGPATLDEASPPRPAASSEETARPQPPRG